MSRRLATFSTVLTVAVLTLTSCTGAPTPSPAPSATISPAPVDDRPNLVLISTDDQADWEMEWMPKTQALIAGAGIEFTDGINPHPLCCPARAEILTGEYAQNNGVRHNEGPHGGYEAFLRRNTHENLAAWLHDSGYTTAFVGKMLNGYNGPDRSEKMDGWDYWSPTIAKTYSYYGTTFENDGDPVTYPDTHVADVVSKASTDLIDQYATSGQPFFLWASHVGPHTAPPGGTGEWTPPIPALRHADWYSDVALATAAKPSFNEDDISDKTHHVRAAKASRSDLTHKFRQRIRTLASIDEAVAATVGALDDAGVLDNTVVAFVSDNGYLLGEHRLSNKNLPYEEALQIPFLLRGPGIAPGTVSNQTASLIDIAPTFLDYAGILETVQASGRTDGESLARAAATTRLSGVALIQSGTAHPGREWNWRGVRTRHHTYARWFDGAEELYDRRNDPYQIHNVADSPDPKHRALLKRARRGLADLHDCAGAKECKPSS